MPIGLITPYSDAPPNNYGLSAFSASLLRHCGIVCHHCIADGKKEEPRFPLTLLQRDKPISKRLLMKKARRFRLARCCALSTVL